MMLANYYFFIQMSNKDIIGQCIITYESVERVSKSLDQLSEGLATLNFLKALRAFPDLFVGILTYTNNITTQMLLILFICESL